MSRPDNRSRALDAVVAEAAGLSQATRDDMYALFSRHYDATTRARFEGDLAAKDYAVLLRDCTDRLQGFSTLAVSRMEIGGRPLRVVFSGDTIIDPAYWGSQAFSYAWIRLIGRIAAEAPDVPLYWLLIVKGHRTYRYLPAFGLRFVPDWRGTADSALETLKDAIAGKLFGPAYDARTGVVSFERSHGHLAPDLAVPTPREMARPEVRFFLQRNPRYIDGDELVCLCALSHDNMRPLTRRLFTQGFARGSHA